MTFNSFTGTLENPSRFCASRVHCANLFTNAADREQLGAPCLACPFGVTIDTAQAEREKAIAGQQKHNAPRPSCAHLGKLTGEALPCSTCGGAKMELVHLCAVHGRCTITRDTKTVAYCGNCREYQANRATSPPY